MAHPSLRTPSLVMGRNGTLTNTEALIPKYETFYPSVYHVTRSFIQLRSTFINSFNLSIMVYRIHIGACISGVQVVTDIQTDRRTAWFGLVVVRGPDKSIYIASTGGSTPSGWGLKTSSTCVHPHCLLPPPRPLPISPLGMLYAMPRAPPPFRRTH